MTALLIVWKTIVGLKILLLITWSLIVHPETLFNLSRPRDLFQYTWMEFLAALVLEVQAQNFISELRVIPEWVLRVNLFSIGDDLYFNLLLAWHFQALKYNSFLSKGPVANLLLFPRSIFLLAPALLPSLNFLTDDLALRLLAIK